MSNHEKIISTAILIIAAAYYIYGSIGCAQYCPCITKPVMTLFQTKNVPSHWNISEKDIKKNIANSFSKNPFTTKTATNSTTPNSKGRTVFYLAFCSTHPPCEKIVVNTIRVVFAILMLCFDFRSFTETAAYLFFNAFDVNNDGNFEFVWLPFLASGLILIRFLHLGIRPGYVFVHEHRNNFAAELN